MPVPVMPSSLAGIARFPRARLGHAPTPLDPAPNLGAVLGIDLWIKRDDCTGFAFGGNKVRQLEFHFGEAEARGADTVLVTGAVQSNLVRIAAAAARRLGMEAHIQLEDRVDGMGALYRTSGNLLLDRVLGATLHAFPEGEDEAAADAAMERRAAALAGEGRRPYVIHSAPGHPPLGGLGYVLAAEEIVDQAPGMRFDAVVCASGSALTHAGILVGLRALGERVPVLGICVRRDAAGQGARVAWVAGALAAMIDCPDAFDAADVEVCDAVLAPGYGRLRLAEGGLVLKIECAGAVVQIRVRDSAPFPEDGGIEVRHRFGLRMPQTVGRMLDFWSVAGLPAPRMGRGGGARTGHL